jgi:hypothetical protein
MLIANVLIPAAAAALEIRTGWFNPPQRSLQNLFHTSPRKTALLFEKRRFNCFAFQHEGHKHSFAGAVFISSEPGEAVAAINEFFYGEFQGRILSYRTKHLGRSLISNWQLEIVAPYM